jgi:protein-S-isoprenylcysteine O-methyltransferase Ste14
MRTCFSQIPDACAVWRRLDDRRRRSTYFKRAAVAKRAAREPGRGSLIPMTPTISKVIFVALVIGWYLIRYKYARRSRREKIVWSARGSVETALLLISLAGLGLVPLVYVATAMPRFAAYGFHPLFAWLGLFFAIAALGMFHLTHRALGRNWSISLDVRERHELVTEGIYRRVRHPMYSAFWLWAIAQALLLPNWIAGFAGLAGFGTLFFGRVAREERMMLETFGDSYRAYMARTGRVFPPIL